jgi:hypothetical protein
MPALLPHSDGHGAGADGIKARLWVEAHHVGVGARPQEVRRVLDDGDGDSEPRLSPLTTRAFALPGKAASHHLCQDPLALLAQELALQVGHPLPLNRGPREVRAVHKLGAVGEDHQAAAQGLVAEANDGQVVGKEHQLAHRRKGGL